MDIAQEFLKTYGPMAIGWLVAGYLIWKDQARKDSDIASRIQMAVALEGLTSVIKGLQK